MIEYLYQSFLPDITHFHSLAYWAAFIAAFAETALVAGLLVPGSTLLLLLGALSATGQIDFAGVFWFGVAGAVLGDNLNYWLGRRYGHRWLKSGIWFFRSEHFEQAHTFFNRNGAKSVFLGRFVPSIKEIAPFIAGSVRMHRWTFLFWNLLAGIGWGLQWIGGGYLFGQSLVVAQAWMSRIGLVFLAVLLLWLAFWYLKHILVRQGPQIWLMVVSISRSAGSALAQNPYLKRFARKHPAFMRFLAQRIDRTRFTGLTTTLFAFTLLYIAILFGGIVEDFLTSDPIVKVDQAVAQLVVRFRPPELIPVFTWITALGITPVVAPAVLLSFFALWSARGRWLAFALLVSAGGTVAFTSLSKLAFHRPRPVEAALLEQSYSFPSGHASIAIGFYGFLCYVLVRSAPDLRVRVNWMLLALLLIALIGLSRILLGVHYLSDVWAGYLIGAGWLTVGIVLGEWATANHRITWKQTSGHRLLPWLLVAAASLWSVYYIQQWHPKTATPLPPVTQAVDATLPAFIRDKQLAQTETIMGAPSQPLSVALVMNDEEQMIAILEQSGWLAADMPTPHNLLKLFNQGMTYQNAPLAPAFWNGRINDLGFERTAVVDGESVIDTLRLWRTPWRLEDMPVYVGVVRSHTATYWRILHRIAPDIDATAQRLLQSLGEQKTSLVSCLRKLGKAQIGSYQSGMEYFSSGQLAIVSLVDSPGTQLCEARDSR